MTLVTQMLRAFQFASRDRGVCVASLPLRVWSGPHVSASACVRLLEENRELSRLICTIGGGLKLPA